MFAKSILIVDDEPGILNILRVKFKLAGYEVLTSTGGAEAIELLKEMNPDILLLDMVMPGMSGLEVIEKVRSFSPVPIVSFTPRREIGELALIKGADDLIDKPFDPDQLVSKVDSILKRAGRQDSTGGRT